MFSKEIADFQSKVLFDIAVLIAFPLNILALLSMQTCNINFKALYAYRYCSLIYET